MIIDKNKQIADIDALLPQTQCGLCTYDGCKPYATAIVENNERIDLCLPGGLPTLEKLGNHLNIGTQSMQASMAERAKSPTKTVIRENACIGCTKCIQACPVDAIIGAPKLMHTVISDACNGCELCIPPCPVDCIDVVDLPERSEIQRNALQTQSRDRFEKHNIRLARIEIQRKEKHQKAKQMHQKHTIDARRAAIADILNRKKLKTY